jgi:hypothetical protein
MLNVYRRFLPHAAATQAPLQDVFSEPRDKGFYPITWTPNLYKTSLSRSTLLVHPVQSAPLALVADASTSAIGFVMQQHINKTWQPFASFLRNSTEIESC